MHFNCSALLRGAAALLSAFAATLALAAQTLVPAGATWKFLDNGSNQGVTWRASAFDDSTWRSGAAELGYGDGDEATVVGFGPDANNKFITTYFRHAFAVADPSSITGLNLRLKRDDGAIVYLNGVEVFRSNMPAGTVTFQTPASGAASDDGGTWQTTTLPRTAVAQGSNVIAVEVHQSSGSSSDITFALELVAETPGTAATVTRGPYLQQSTANEMTIRWRTDIATDSRVRFGTSQGAPNLAADASAVTTEHIVRVTGLAPNTTYFYSIGTTQAILAGGDAAHRFTTSPAAGTATATRVWVLGDAGTKTAGQRSVRDAFVNFTGARSPDLMLMLGDNAYESGTDSEYQVAVFDMYQDTLRRTPVWPTIGNHDTAQSSNPPATLPYFQMFSLPTAAEAGGLASGTESYYSFDYGNIHFVCLDSMTSDRSATGAMATWLRNDLAASTRDWVIAYWHHPPYSKGSHDSDSAGSIEEAMRQNFLPILEANGVDLVLSGHSHAYERSYLLDSHYGNSTTLTAAMKKNAGDGRPAGNGAYTKPFLGRSAHDGAVYVVAGSSGQASGGSLNHPAMFISLNQLGSLVLDINGNRLDATFLRETGAQADTFTLVKGVTGNRPPTVSLSAPANGASVRVGTPITIAANANDPDGSVAKVDFFQGAGLIGTATAAPYQLVWTPAAAGTIALTAKATDNAGAAATSAVVNVTATSPPPVIPAAPSSLAATVRSSARIDLAWTDNATNETGFIVERSRNGGAFSTVATLGPNVRSFASTGLRAASNYAFRVRAFNSAGNSAFSNTATARTP